MDTVDTAFLSIGTSVLVLSLLARPLKERLWLSEPLLGMLIGLGIGPAGLALLELPWQTSRASVLEQVARLTVALSIMGVALRLPDRYIFDRWRTLLGMLGIVMPLMWLAASALALFMLGMPVLLALWLGAVVTPTDPVLADAIVTGELAESAIDPEVRHLISAESGANDGLAYLLVMFPVTVLQHGWRAAPERWLIHTLLGEVLLALVLGAAAGWLVGQLIRRGLDQDEVGEAPRLAIVSALAIALLGGVHLIGADGLIAVFAAGLTLNLALRGRHEARQNEVQEVITRFFDTPVFILFGLLLPVDAWHDLGPRALAFAVAVVLLRRLPVVLLLRPLLDPVHTLRQAAFVGWFGPVGAAALVYATWATSHAHREQIWSAGSLVVFVSVVAHGVTATPFTRWFARVRSHGS